MYIIKLSVFSFLLSLFISFHSAIAWADSESHELYDKAKLLLQQANKAEQDSRKAILDANQTRKETNRLRAQQRKTKDKGEQEKLMQKADALATQLSKMQRRGAELRDKNQSLKNEAIELFEEAMVKSWAPKIKNRNPIMMVDSQAMFFAHNTQFRSVHPTMLNKMGTPSELLDKDKLDKEMSIMVPALVGQNAPPDLDISSFQISREQEYFAHIEVMNESAAPLNEIHKWYLMISDLNGKPLRNAKIEVVGHMPGHVHGLPTQPRVTKEVSPGVYLVDGLKFQMKGWWVMQFNILKEEADASTEQASQEQAKDSVVFNLVL